LLHGSYAGVQANGQQQSPPCEFSKREAGTVPRTVAVKVGHKLQCLKNDFISKMTWQAPRDSSNAFRGRPANHGVLVVEAAQKRICNAIHFNKYVGVIVLIIITSCSS